MDLFQQNASDSRIGTVILYMKNTIIDFSSLHTSGTTVLFLLNLMKKKMLGTSFFPTHSPTVQLFTLQLQHKSTCKLIEQYFRCFQYMVELYTPHIPVMSTGTSSGHWQYKKVALLHSTASAGHAKAKDKALVANSLSVNSKIYDPIASSTVHGSCLIKPAGKWSDFGHRGIIPKEMSSYRKVFQRYRICITALLWGGTELIVVSVYFWAKPDLSNCTFWN